eukprot:6174068-Pleurochrysis_carterae.AAC.1
MSEWSAHEPAMCSCYCAFASILDVSTRSIATARRFGGSCFVPHDCTCVWAALMTSKTAGRGGEQSSSAPPTLSKGALLFTLQRELEQLRLLLSVCLLHNPYPRFQGQPRFPGYPYA